MTVDVANRPIAETAGQSRLAIADCDIHPRPAGAGIGGVSKSLYPYLSKQWRDHLEQFGVTYRQPWEKGSAYPKGQPSACRIDAWPPGKTPGSDLEFMARQHLDPNNVTLGILNPLGAGQGAMNLDLSAALAHATNEWQKAEWTSQDSRLRASVVVPYEDPMASVKEIEKRAGRCLAASAGPSGRVRNHPRPADGGGVQREPAALHLEYPGGPMVRSAGGETVASGRASARINASPRQRRA